MGLALKPTVSCLATNLAAGWLIVALAVLPSAASSFGLLEEVPSAVTAPTVQCAAYPGASSTASQMRSLLQFPDAVRSQKAVVAMEGDSISGPMELEKHRLLPQTGNSSYSKDALSALHPLGLADAVVLSHLVTLQTPLSLTEEAQRRQFVTDQMTDALVQSFFQHIFFDETLTLFTVPVVLVLLSVGVGVACLCGFDNGAGSSSRRMSQEEPRKPGDLPQSPPNAQPRGSFPMVSPRAATPQAMRASEPPRCSLSVSSASALASSSSRAASGGASFGGGTTGASPVLAYHSGGTGVAGIGSSTSSLQPWRAATPQARLQGSSPGLPPRVPEGESTLADTLQQNANLLCRGLLVPPGTECILAVPTLDNAGVPPASNGSLIVRDMAGLPIVALDIARPDGSFRPICILKTTSSNFAEDALAICTARPDNSVVIGTSAHEVFATLSKTGDVYTLVADPMGARLKFEGDIASHSWKVSNSRRVVADTKRATVKFDAGEYYQMRATAHSDCGLLLCAF
eukprot:CAMPEP_0178413616 /NCGR_PEP_ID=MMETSP0689_2-20121128/22618_1 /TAXON_ID=160604 /ORGANISM="Amphidinium massartii, Strain CS-259" /LENGTH=514 /DNA_ID=CAMNT_0020034891 /DNA_START=160 /DNA_END=1701 /DNA_ORIENTATION=+